MGTRRKRRTQTGSKSNSQVLANAMPGIEGHRHVLVPGQRGVGDFYQQEHVRGAGQAAFVVVWAGPQDSHVRLRLEPGRHAVEVVHGEGMRGGRQ